MQTHTTLSTDLKQINMIVAVGSVDGVLTTSALLRLIGGDPAAIGLVFCQAFTVDKLQPESWGESKKVALVDLAVNNREPAMTTTFVERLWAASHTLVAVIDEHNRADWEKVLGTFEGLLIEPKSQAAEDGPKSSGEVLRQALLGFWRFPEDSELVELMADANKADRMDFTGRFASMVNQAMKSAIADDTRRVYLARHLAQATEADSKIQGWIKEYEEILANHQVILDSKIDLGDGVVRVSTVGKKVDVTTLMSQLYKAGARVVVMEAEMFDKAIGAKTRQIAFGTGEKLDLLAAIKVAVPEASGFAQKTNVPPEHELAALEAIRQLLGV